MKTAPSNSIEASAGAEFGAILALTGRAAPHRLRHSLA
jgi:hypothetical protein